MSSAVESGRRETDFLISRRIDIISNVCGYAPLNRETTPGDPLEFARAINPPVRFPRFHLTIGGEFRNPSVSLHYDKSLHMSEARSHDLIPEELARITGALNHDYDGNDDVRKELITSFGGACLFMVAEMVEGSNGHLSLAQRQALTHRPFGQTKTTRTERVILKRARQPFPDEDYREELGG